ncbi:hypothetical protein BST61_g8811 [Cercospora zeina]
MTSTPPAAPTMTSTVAMRPDSSPEQVDSKLRDELEKFNAQHAQQPQRTTERVSTFEENAGGLGIHDGFDRGYSDEHSFSHDPPTPRSNTASEGVQTRSGRSTRTRTDSPFSTSKSRVSKSPAPRKREKKSKLDRSKMPKLTAPLSILTKDMDVPLKDTEAFVNRSVAERMKEVSDHNGYIKRPQNSFILYRSAYADRCKKWCELNNHQIVSSVAGESWPMESEEVRNQFDEWAKIERQHHQEAHPKYKFSPSKSANKRRKGEATEDEEEPSDLDDCDPDGEYRGGRQVRQRRHDPNVAYFPSNVGFSSHPYYDQNTNGYEQSHFQYANAGRPLPSNVAYDPHTGQPYHTQTHTWIQASPQQQYAQNPYVYQEMHATPRIATPASLNGQQSTMGSLGLPGGSGSEEFFSSSRTSTPQHYNQQQQYGGGVYGQHAYPQYQDVVDPNLQGFQLEAGAPGETAGESHFDNALGDLNDMAGLPMHDYYPRNSTSPVDANATLAPTWNVAQEMR